MRDWRQRFLELHQDLGICRKGIDDYIGAELRALWDIAPEIQDSIQIRRRVGQALEDLFLEHSATLDKSKEDALLSLRVSYNVSELLKTEGLEFDGNELLGRRQRRLAKLRSGDEESQLSTIRGHVRAFQNYAVPTIAAQLASQPTPLPQPASPSSRSSTPEFPPPRQPLPRDRRLAAAALGAAVALVIAGITFVVLDHFLAPSDPHNSSPPQPTSQGQGSAPSTSASTAIPSRKDIAIKSRFFTIEDEPGSVMPGIFRPSPALAQQMHQQNGSFGKELQNILRASAVKLSALTIEINVTGLSPKPVRVNDIKVIVYNRREPINGTLFRIPTGQGVDPTKRLRVSLDASQPIVRDLIFPPQVGEVVDMSPPKVGDPFFAKNTVSLRKGEDHTFLIETLVTRHYVEFGFELQYIANGEQKKEAINNSGRPFLVTGPRCGTTVGSYSYQRIFTMQGNLSLAQEANPVNYGESHRECGG